MLLNLVGEEESDAKQCANEYEDYVRKKSDSITQAAGVTFVAEWMKVQNRNEFKRRTNCNH